jgi:hypothetical protein
MLSSINVSSMLVIAVVSNAILLAKQTSQPVEFDVVGIQLTVTPDSTLSEIVALWETEFEKREK